MRWSQELQISENTYDGKFSRKRKKWVCQNFNSWIARVLIVNDISLINPFLKWHVPHTIKHSCVRHLFLNYTSIIPNRLPFSTLIDLILHLYIFQNLYFNNMFFSLSLLSIFNNFVEAYFIYLKIHPFQLHNTMIFSIFKYSWVFLK